MLRARIIPCLLIHNKGLVKTIKFSNPKYVGDPINAVRIFNEKQADELMILDIDASVKDVGPSFGLIEKLAAECSMPLCYGGGVKSKEHVIKIVNMGVEKVAVSSAVFENFSVLNEMVSSVGSQSVVVVFDIKQSNRMFSKKYNIYTHNGTKLASEDPLKMLQKVQEAGVGEVVFNFIDRDGTMKGYDLEYAKILWEECSIPITFLGGAGSLEHVKQLISDTENIGAAAGSMFVFKGKYRAVLINYPSFQEKMEICKMSDQHKLIT